MLSNSAQNFDDIISSNRYINCDDVTFNAATMIRGFYDNSQIDKIYDYLDYWESKCGKLEIIDRFRTILDINSNRYNPRLISESTIEDLMLYRSNVDFANDTVNTFFRRDTEINQNLSSIDRLAQRIASQSRAGTWDEEMILDFYANDTPNFRAIKNASNSSRLKQAHASSLEKANKMWEWHYALIAGVYSPSGNISLFGDRPTIGLMLGAKRLRHNLDFVMDVRIGPSAEEYSFVYQGELLTDDTWSGFYVGGEYTYDFINTKKFDLGISGGLGYENITALRVDEDSDDEDKTLGSFNWNAGLVLKYKYGRHGGYFGLHARYNWVDYSNNGGTPLDGEYINLRLSVGNIFNHLRDRRLRNLD